MYDPNEVLIARVNEILSEAAEEDEGRLARKKEAETVRRFPLRPAWPKVNGATPRPRPADSQRKELPVLARVVAATEEKRRWHRVLGVTEGEVTRS